MVQTATAKEVDVKTVAHKPMVQDRFLSIFLWNCTERFQMNGVFVIVKEFGSGANKSLCI